MDLLDDVKKLKETGISGVENLGMLSDLDELQKIEVAQHIINAVNILEEENLLEIKIANRSEYFYMYVIPIFRRMLMLLLENKNSQRDELLKNFDAKDFIFYLNDMMQHLEKMDFLKNLDHEVEFVRLLCENYFKIIERNSWEKRMN